MSIQAIIIDAVVCCILGAAIGSGKGQSGAGFWLGLLLGPLGVLLCLTMKATPAYAAARAEAIEAEREQIRAQRDGATAAAQQPSDS